MRQFLRNIVNNICGDNRQRRLDSLSSEIDSLHRAAAICTCKAHRLEHERNELLQRGASWLRPLK